mmetsp:Transcript_17289/g.47580  ORF Transcript_17289/g.47580 Transcript_17289/m.47580 type:complete len:135 (-) Transcript_17289:1306-1710(-)
MWIQTFDPIIRFESFLPTKHNNSTRSFVSKASYHSRVSNFHFVIELNRTCFTLLTESSVPSQIPRSFARVWPGPRAESRMAQAGGTLYLFGGFGTKGFSRLLLLLNCKSIACVISRPCINENPLLGSAGRFMVF